MLSFLIRPLLQKLEEVASLLRENNQLQRELFAALTHRQAQAPRANAGLRPQKTDRDVFVPGQEAKSRQTNQRSPSEKSSVAPPT